VGPFSIPASCLTQGSGSAIMSSNISCLLVVVSTLGASDTLAYSPVHTYPNATMPREMLINSRESTDRVSDTGHLPGTAAVYFDASPAPLNAYTYSASVRLLPSASKAVLQGEFRFPVFRTTPSVSVQIISSIGAVPLQVKTVKVSESAGSSGNMETQIIVQAEPLFNLAASGLYYANVVVMGVPVTPPTSNFSELLN
jgi:hypothetical protein